MPNASTVAATSAAMPATCALRKDRLCDDDGDDRRHRQPLRERRRSTDRLGITGGAECILGERRHDAAADQRDQGDDQIRRRPQCRRRVAEMKEAVEPGQRRTHEDDAVIAGISCGEDVAADDRGEHRQEQEVDPGEPLRQHGDTSDQPERAEGRQRHAAQSAGRPVQLGTAVNRKPAMAAAAKPKIIS